MISLIKALLAYNYIVFKTKNEVGKKVLWKNIRIATEKLEELVFDNQEHARIVNNIDNFLSDYEVERGWEFLFDGKTFKGWRSAKGDSFLKRDGIYRMDI